MPAQVKIRRSSYTGLTPPGSIRRPSAPVHTLSTSPIIAEDGPLELHVSPVHTLDGPDASPRRGSRPTTSRGNSETGVTPPLGTAGVAPQTRSRSRTIQGIFDPQASFFPPASSTLPAPNSPTRPRSGSTASQIAPDTPQAHLASRVRAATVIQRARAGSVSLAAGSGGAQVDVRPRSGSFGRVRSRDSEARRGSGGRESLTLGEARGSVSHTTGGREMVDLSKVEMEQEKEDEEHHHEEVVEHLDVIDAEVGTVSHLQNAANTIMFPNIPQLWNRRPVVSLPEPRMDEESVAGLITEDPTRRPSAPRLPSVIPEDGSIHSTTPLPISPSDLALDVHVEDCLRKRDKLKRTLKGTWKFLKTPLGVVAGIYMFLVIFWGAAIVLFLAKWINAGSDYYQTLWIEITSQIENGLFSITNIGLIPWRLIDARRITVIWILRRRSRNLRKAQGLPPIENIDDLPDPRYDPDFVQVLSPYDQARLQYMQEKFMASQTWYRPHATETHRAFSINYAVAICFNIVGNSLFQCALSGCMWGLNRYNRPAATTGILMPASFLCMIASGVLIWLGGAKTKKTAEVESKLREALGIDSPDEKLAIEGANGEEGGGDMEMKKVGNGVGNGESGSSGSADGESVKEAGKGGLEKKGE